MRNYIKYTIKEVTHKDGTKKEIPQSWYLEYSIHVARLGRSAFLVSDKGKTLRTSVLENIELSFDEVTLTTMNTTYVLKPVEEGGYSGNIQIIKN